MTEEEANEMARTLAASIERATGRVTYVYQVQAKTVVAPLSLVGLPGISCIIAGLESAIHDAARPTLSSAGVNARVEPGLDGEHDGRAGES